MVVSEFKYHLLYQLYYVVDQCRGVKDNINIYEYILAIGIIEKPSEKEEKVSIKPELESQSSETIVTVEK